MSEVKSLISIRVPVRGEIDDGSFSAVPYVDPIHEKGSRSIHKKRDKTWKKRSQASAKTSVVKRRNAAKRVLTPGKVDPKAGHKKLYTRQRHKK